MTDINGGTESFGLTGSHPLSQGMERYFKLLGQQAEFSRQLAVGWAGAMQTMSGILLKQTSTMGKLVAVQAEAIAEQSSETDDNRQGNHRPVLGLIHGSAPEATHQRETSPADWAVEQETLRYNVFDEVFARLLEDDIEEAVV